ncbi:hypothetical protein [Pseudobacter ginsenosidimutans]|uniref:Lipoprotein n=1 Tax=Pseudobacter ginsenosidimutans TaxID=661488 RepID=A0A4Q7MVE2_9BACT|nr:hypothetical protein [Pseudobacter ginsenosidimutans]QEC40644.1 hypothetical protein FSB84_02630 [Pseudobacter ginsenosidimutans]RZS72637.1 hypothetical protein EV199_4559 [Pseudobacter ginsenosidimutans]
MKSCIIFLLPLFLTSCITSSVIKKAATDRKPQRIHQIRDAWTDTSGNIIVNFTAKLSGTKRNVPVHLVVPVNTLMRIYLKYNSVKGEFSPGEKLLYGVNRIHSIHYNTSDSLAYTPEIEYQQEKVLEGFYAPGPTDSNITHRFRLPIDPDEYRYETDWIMKKQKRMLFLYQPAIPYQSTYVPINNIAISVEPSHKRKYTRYLLTLVTIPADVATAPLQGIAAGYMMLLAWAMRF